MVAPFLSVLSGPNPLYLGTIFPSGQIPSGYPGSTLEAYLLSMRARFGFSSEPHQFELNFAPVGSGYGHGASGQLAPINTELSMWVSGFYLRGLISHIDWSSNDAGSILNVTLRDKRLTLDKYKITTNDLGDSVPSGVVSVAREFRLANGISQSVTRYWPVTSGTFTETESLDINFREYQRILENGATWPQIYSAINSVFGSGVANQLPSPADIQTNTSGNINSIRLSFNLETLRETLNRLTVNTGFDWYWNMGQEKVSLINKKLPFYISEAEILSLINAYGGSGIENVKSIQYGRDVIDEPTQIQLLGANQEGIMNSRLLSPIDGLDTIYDGVSPSSTLVFRAAWPLLTIGFYDASGFYRTYVPGEKELQMSLAGPEQWTYFKKYQTAASPSGWNLPEDEGSIAAQHPDFQSRLDPRQPIAEILSNPSGNIRVINNRRDLTSNWVIEFINRVNQHAQRHYGKSYVATNALIRDSKVFTLIESAWCNVENQREVPSGLFTDDYEISHQYGPIAPFFGEDAKVRAHVKLPSGTVYGPLGEDIPTAFGNWTEDAQPFNPSGDGSHYIPCQLAVVGRRVQDPLRDDNFSLEVFPEDTLYCGLPEIAASGTISDNVLASLSTLTEYALSLGQSGIIDLIDPRRVVVPYPELSGVAIPVRSNLRYGMNYPYTWVSGNPHPIYGLRTEIDDNLAPWIEFPEGTEDSIVKLNRKAFDRIDTLLIVQPDSQFMEVRQVGLPRISFDGFANQALNASGMIGEREHGVNECNIDYGDGGLVTTYKIQSYYQTIGKSYPLVERTRFRINGVLNPIDFADLGNFFASIGKGVPAGGFSNNGGFGSKLLNFDFERQESCTIVGVNNIFNEAAVTALMNGQEVPTEERYYGVINRRIHYTYSVTDYVLSPGLNTVGHNLNSLVVSVVFLDNTLGLMALPSLELDAFSVVVSNNTGQSLTGLIMISNGEGNFRPTNETIRNSDQVDDYGAVCNDGYLNLGDVCVYLHKRVDGQELAYFTGGRKISPGSIVEVEEIQTGTSPTKYNVSLLSDQHNRWIYSIPSLNDTSISVGTQVTIAGGSNLDPTPGVKVPAFKPGPDCGAGWALIAPATAGGGGTAVQIMTLSAIGTSGTTATVRVLDASGFLTGEQYSNVYILPYPQFAETNDRGIMATYTPTSGFTSSTTRYVQVSKSKFIVF